MVSVIDSHFHIWRREDLPWLNGPMVPRIFGPYEPIRRDYTIEEYLADIAGTGVEKSVYVQTNWAKAGAVDEVAWVQATADAHGWPTPNADGFAAGPNRKGSTELAAAAIGVRISGVRSRPRHSPTRRRAGTRWPDLVYGPGNGWARLAGSLDRRL